jgi:hypothetical protein
LKTMRSPSLILPAPKLRMLVFEVFVVCTAVVTIALPVGATAEAVYLRTLQWHPDYPLDEEQYIPSDVLYRVILEEFTPQLSIENPVDYGSAYAAIWNYFDAVRDSDRQAFVEIVGDLPNWDEDQIYSVERGDYPSLTAGGAFELKIASCATVGDSKLIYGFINSKKFSLVLWNRNTMQHCVASAFITDEALGIVAENLGKKWTMSNHDLTVAESSLENYFSWSLLPASFFSQTELRPVGVYAKVSVPDWGRVVLRSGEFVVDESEDEHRADDLYELVRFYRDTMATYAAIPKDGTVSLDSPFAKAFLGRLHPLASTAVSELCMMNSSGYIDDSALLPYSPALRTSQEILGIVESYPFYYIALTPELVTESNGGTVNTNSILSIYWMRLYRVGDTFRVLMDVGAGSVDKLLRSGVHTNKVLIEHFKSAIQSE